MDSPTRIGLGGTALFTLAGIGAPLFGWYISGPIMAVCAGVAAWGFWPIIERKTGLRLPRFLKIVRNNLSDEYAEIIPNLRVADSPSVIDLFEGNERDRLFPLLEGDQLTAWARPMRGEAPGKEAAPVRLKGDIWKTHYFLFTPRTPGQFDRNQTFVKEKIGQISHYFDVFLNSRQIKRVWPDLEYEFVSLREAARLAHEVTEGTMYGKLNDRLDVTPSERTEHHIDGILNRKLVLYGKTPPSSMLRPIPRDEMSSLRWFEGTDALKSRYASQPGHYEDVVVGRISLQGYLDHLKRIGGTIF
jgi:hypothetical protein